MRFTVLRLGGMFTDSFTPVHLLVVTVDDL